jgi:mannosyltransferase OCH1-like enzyme
MSANDAIPNHLLVDANKIVQGLWVGSELSVMEQLSIASFLLNDHEYHLYVYGSVDNVPAGTVVKDANEILPASSIFQYRHSPTYAGFANFFRYKLLLERGGWWADTDTICLKPFDFPDSYVFASEICREREVINSGIIKAPADSLVMDYAWKVCQTKIPQQLVWGETGPSLIAEAVTRHSLEQYKKPHYVFCPISYTDWQEVIEANGEIVLNEHNHAIHLWNEMWRSAGQDKNERYHPDCLYEQLKRRYLRT